MELSPDGRTLAVLTTPGSRTTDPSLQQKALILVSVADGSSRELVRLSPQEALPQQRTIAWTPDSRSVLFAKAVGGQPELWSLDTASGATRRFDVDGTDWKAAMQAGDFNFLDGGFSLSPDGRRVAFLMGKSGAEVWALENFLPATTAPRQTAARK